VLATDARAAVEDVNERRRAAAPAFRDMKVFAERLTKRSVRSRRQCGPLPSLLEIKCVHAERWPAPGLSELSAKDEADPGTDRLYVLPWRRVLMGKPSGIAVGLGRCGSKSCKRRISGVSRAPNGGEGPFMFCATPKARFASGGRFTPESVD